MLRVQRSLLLISCVFLLEFPKIDYSGDVLAKIFGEFGVRNQVLPVTLGLKERVSDIVYVHLLGRLER